LGAFCTIFRGRPVGTCLGAKFGRKPAKKQIQHPLEPTTRLLDCSSGGFPGPIAPAMLPLDVTQYRCLPNKRPPKPYQCIRFGALDVTKPCKFIWFGGIHCPKTYKCIGLRWIFISQTQVVFPGRKSAFRAGFWVDCYRENTEIRLRRAEGRPAGRFQGFPGSSPAKMRPGRPIYGQEALLRNIE
jgi:hypothetical protein